MTDKNGIHLTARDRVLRAWQNSTELVRDYQNYAREMQDEERLSDLFAEYAESEAKRAAHLLELLHEMER